MKKLSSALLIIGTLGFATAGYSYSIGVRNESQVSTVLVSSPEIGFNYYVSNSTGAVYGNLGDMVTWAVGPDALTYSSWTVNVTNGNTPVCSISFNNALADAGGHAIASGDSANYFYTVTNSSDPSQPTCAISQSPDYSNTDQCPGPCMSFFDGTIAEVPLITISGGQELAPNASLAPSSLSKNNLMVIALDPTAITIAPLSLGQSVTLTVPLLKLQNEGAFRMTTPFHLARGVNPTDVKVAVKPSISVALTVTPNPDPTWAGIVMFGQNTSLSATTRSCVQTQYLANMTQNLNVNVSTVATAAAEKVATKEAQQAVISSGVTPTLRNAVALEINNYIKKKYAENKHAVIDNHDLHRAMKKAEKAAEKVINKYSPLIQKNIQSQQAVAAITAAAKKAANNSAAATISTSSTTALQSAITTCINQSQ